MSYSVLVVIPARYDSSRLPGKPLADIVGKPMIQRVWEQASSMPYRVVVATDSDRVADCTRAFGGEVFMTSSVHRNGTERVAEVARQAPADVIVNLQGDLPLFRPDTLERIIELGVKDIQAHQVDMVTIKSEITTPEEAFSPQAVKVVTDAAGNALYFSRSTVPYIPPTGTLPTGVQFFRHYGVYIYRLSFLLHVAGLPEGRLEQTERLEQLRVLEAGGRIRVIEVSREEAASFWEVNTPEELQEAKKRINAYNSV